MAVRIEPHAEPIPGYKLLDRLGAGGFGEVWRAEAPGGIFKAVKVIHGDLHSTDHDLVRYAEQELKSLRRVKQVRHPYLLALDRFDIVEGRLLIVMELADCNLWDRFRECRDLGLQGIPRDELLLYMVETAEVLDLFNDQFQLQHLDIKPQNLFLLSNHVKVADFGQVKDLQGLVAPVTGGITPVYAAPETFDGIITRTCDQYSLACVYQELLTGIRPFDGCTMNQLLIQHLNHPPNLEPSPPCDRPALARGLAKKPEDRWPSVSSFVRGLLGTSTSGRISVPIPRSVPAEPRPETYSPTPFVAENFESHAESMTSTPTPSRGFVPVETLPPRDAAEPVVPAPAPPPPEMAGPGPLRPALIIGMGRAGQQVLRRLRFDLSERYGQPQKTPIVRTILVDTDPDDLSESIRPDPANRLAGLDHDEVFQARLNRASHYMKPRLSGRTLTDGWFDAQLLYRIPRVPQTMGVRMFGRLAFCDYYRPLMGKIHSSLDAVLAADAMTLTETTTGLLRRTNRPVVYVVAGLAGGTGGGMLLDMAYAVRNRLKRMGYESPEVIGVLVVPPSDPAKTPPQHLANTFAALTELNHYSRPETSFVAHYDERHGVLREKDPPFLRCYIVPGPALERRGSPGANGHARTSPNGTPPSIGSHVIAKPGSRVIAKPGSRVIAKPGSRVMPALGSQPELEPLVLLAALKPYADIADLIRLNLFSPLGRRIDETRAAAKAANPENATLAAFGMSGFGWPRAEVVARTSFKAARAVLRRWATPNPQRMREVIPALAQKHWSQLGLEPETVQSTLQRIAKETIGTSVEAQISKLTDPLVPRGWLGRLPDPEKVAIAFDQLSQLFGAPGSSRRRQPGTVETAVAAAAAEAAGGCGLDVHALVPTLVDDPQFRLSGAEDMLRQFQTTTDRLIDRFLQTATDEDAKARTAFNTIAQYAHYKKGMRKPSAAELVDALRQYPKSQFQALLARQTAGVYHAVREVLAQQLTDVSARLETANKSSPVLVAEVSEIPPGGRLLMPPGCNGIADAVEKFAEIINEADLNEIDRRVQMSIEPDYGTVFQACLNSSTGSEDVITAVYEESRAHLEARLGMANLASMFQERYCTPALAERALSKSYLDAEPALGKSSWTAGEVVVVGCPAGEGGAPLRELAGKAIPVPMLPFADTPDDLTVYREWPDVPLASLPHAGSIGESAFRQAGESQQCTPHSRIDVAVWMERVAPQS